MSAIRRFRIETPEEDLVDLRRRIHATRWPDRETVDDWSQGAPLAYVRELAAYWADGYAFAPDRPGLGVEIDESVAEAKAAKPGGWPPLLRRNDGAFTNW